MSVKETITDKLTAAFSPTRLEVIDESEQHHGHAGWRAGGETHFRVKISSPGLAGLSRVERHRQIMGVLQAELAGPVHALAIEVN